MLETETVENIPLVSLDKSTRYIFRAISFFCIIVFAFMLILPILDAVGRKVGFSIPGSSTWIQHFVLWIAFLAAILTTIQKRHLSIGILKIFDNRFDLKKMELFVCIINVSILFALGYASSVLVRFQMDSPENISGWFPLWIAQAILLIAFALMAWVTVTTCTSQLISQIFIVLISVAICLTFFFVPDSFQLPLTIIFIVIVLVLSVFGMPIYALLAGTSILLFFISDIPVAALPAETYRILTQPVLPSIPLFALAGTVLASGGAPKRLISLILAWTSWLPGGPALATIFGCAIFTAITGASGVTILALGSLLLPVLISAQYSKKFGIGLLTSSGSLGLLFPPSLPVILYGVYAHVAIDKLFLAAFVPGLLLVIFLAMISIIRRNVTEKSVFNFRQAIKSLWEAKGDIVLPFLIIFGFFGGFLTLVETAACTALWAILLETCFFRNIKINKQLLNVIVEASVLSGALLIVLGLASGFLSYMVDMQIPDYATDLVMKYISSKYIFLLALNFVLLLIGAIMDIYSAIVIVVPLIVPIANAFGINPVHLGVIFLANLELGYLTPPIGLNLFLSSLRFKESLLSIWKTVIPFMIIFLIWVLLITYIPFLSIGLWNF